jgi:hypothetical protein
MSSIVTILPTDESYSAPLAWSSATSLTFADLAKVNDQDVKALRKSLGGIWTMDEIDFTMIELFVYDGFDHKTLYRALAHIQKTKGLTLATMKDVVSKALAIHQLTGNITAKRFAAMKGPGKQMVNEVIQSLNIRVGKKSGLNRADFTFPRLGALFPFALSVIANKFPKDFASKYNTTNLPAYMKTSSFPSLIPTSVPYTQLLLIAYTCYSIDMTVALRGKDYSTIKPEELVSIIAAQENFARLSLNSGVMDQSERIKAMRALRVDSQETHEKLRSVAASFGMAAIPSWAEWNTALVSSYNTINGKDGRPLAALPGVALQAPDVAPAEETIAGPSQFD